MINDLVKIKNVCGYKKFLIFQRHAQSKLFLELIDTTDKPSSKKVTAWRLVEYSSMTCLITTLICKKGCVARVMA